MHVKVSEYRFIAANGGVGGDNDCANMIVRTDLFVVTECMTTILSYEDVTRYVPSALHCRHVMTFTWLLQVSSLPLSIAPSMILS